MKTKTPYTLGPWAVGRMKGPDGQEQKVIMSADGEEFIAQVNDNDSEYDNARSALLAAAPDLLVALRDARAMLRTCGCDRYDLEEINAAIAKAKGKSA